MIGHLHDQASLLPGKEPQVSIEQEAKWNSRVDLGILERENSLASAHYRPEILGLATSNLVTILP
jgi:hypothetical protein